MSINELVAQWVARHIIDDDPTPTLSTLDRQDGLS